MTPEHPARAVRQSTSRALRSAVDVLRSVAAAPVTRQPAVLGGLVAVALAPAVILAGHVPAPADAAWHSAGAYAAPVAAGQGGAAAPAAPIQPGTASGQLGRAQQPPAVPRLPRPDSPSPGWPPATGDSPTSTPSGSTTSAPAGPAPIVLAHRGGAEKAPDNSMAAFNDAIALGVGYLETDVRHSSDGVAYLIHDPALPPTCTDFPGEAVDTLTAAQLSLVHCGGQPLVTLTDLVARLMRRDAARVAVMAEVKDTDPLGVRNALAPLGWRRVVIQSFLFDALREIERDSPQVRTCPLLWKASEAALTQALAVTHDCVAPDYHGVDAAFVARAHAAGAVVYPFTADDPTAMATLTALDVDGIITNRPRTLLAAERSSRR